MVCFTVVFFFLNNQTLIFAFKDFFMASNLNTIHYLLFFNVLLEFPCKSFTHHYLFAYLYFLWNVQWIYAKIENLSLIRLPSSWSIFYLNRNNGFTIFCFFLLPYWFLLLSLLVPSSVFLHFSPVTFLW